MKMLNKEECDNALTRLLRPYFAKVDVQNVYHEINKGHSIDEDSNMITALMIEYSKIVELIKKWGLIDLSIEELGEWHDRVVWHVDRCDELGRELHVIKNPQPYKFEDLKEGMWVWDDFVKVCIQIYDLGVVGEKESLCFYEDVYKKEVKIILLNEFKSFVFEEGRFFPLTKAYQYQ